MKQDKDIKDILKLLPNTPGVYRMIDKNGKVIYVGKANNLGSRVRQYFKKDYQHSTRTRKLVENICDIKTTTVDSELEAVILESNLIKQLQPKYNILMKDDKNYVYIKITNDDFPTVRIVRKIEKDGAKYIGPKTAAHKVKDTLKMLKKLFPFRHCGLGIDLISEEAQEKNGEMIYPVKVSNKVIKYPCLDFYIKRCIAPCIGKCSRDQYKTIIENATDFLEGKGDKILKDLKTKMQTLASNKEFEKAAKLRDTIPKIESILEKQKVSEPNQSDKDIINYCIGHDRAYFNLFQVRDGQLIGQENFILGASELGEEESEEVLQAFVKQYYSISANIPKEILLPHGIQEQKEIQEYINSQSSRKVKFLIPQKGKKYKLLELSAKNARIYADRNKPSWKTESKLTKEAAESLQKILKIKDPLKRIECYDISHLSGTETVGSMVVFKNGSPKNNLYRKFQLRTIKDKPDDFKSMEEVLYRRFSKISRSINLKDFKFKKARKKDHEFIEKNSKIKVEESDKEFFILEKGKSVTGFIGLHNHSAKVSELTNLWVAKKYRGKRVGHKLIKGAIKKAKSKRTYILNKEALKEYYQLIGFEEIKKIPEDLINHYKQSKKKIKDLVPMAIEKIKVKEDESFKEIPDLVIIDGGKGQLSSAHKIFTQLELTIPHIALAKRLEEIFQPGSSISIQLEKNNKALHLVQRMRDEAHRFAITYNRKLRSKKLTRK
jgi:excinuclease ABC subunit C